MFIILGSVALVISVLLILIVVVQNSKGGGLSSTFGANNISSMIGARRATQDIEKFTWYLAAALLLVAFCTNVFASKDELGGDQASRMQAQMEEQSYLPAQQTGVPSVPPASNQQPNQ